MRKYILCIAMFLAIVCVLGGCEEPQTLSLPYVLAFPENGISDFLALDRDADDLVKQVEYMIGYPEYCYTTDEERRQYILELMDVLENTEFIMLSDRLPDNVNYYTDEGTVTAYWRYGEGCYSTCTVYLPSAPQDLLMKHGEYLTREPESLGRNLDLYATGESSFEYNNETEYRWVGYLKYKGYYITCGHRCIVDTPTALDAESMIQTIRNAPRATIAEYAMTPYVCIGMVAGVLTAAH